jgi:hypothetical protein
MKDGERITGECPVAVDFGLPRIVNDELNFAAVFAAKNKLRRPDR